LRNDFSDRLRNLSLAFEYLILNDSEAEVCLDVDDVSTLTEDIAFIEIPKAEAKSNELKSLISYAVFSLAGAGFLAALVFYALLKFFS
jgi:hypothetical protein